MPSAIKKAIPKSDKILKNKLKVPKRQDHANKDEARVSKLKKIRPRRPTSTLGYLDYAPLEIKFNILKLLPVKDLAKLACCSKSSNELVSNFLKEKNVLLLMVQECFDDTLEGVNKSKCYNLGLVLRALIAPHSFNTGLRIIVKNFYRYIEAQIIANQICLEDPDGSKFQIALGFVLKAILKNRSKVFLEKAFHAIGVKAVLKGLKLTAAWNPRANSLDKLKLRYYYRRLFLDPYVTWVQRTKILEAILDLVPNNRQRAALLQVLYGPVNNVYSWDGEVISLAFEGSPVWHLLPRISLVSNNLITMMLKELGECLAALCQHSAFNAHQMTELFKELTAFPLQWLPNNVALLLLSTNQQFLMQYMLNLTCAMMEYSTNDDKCILYDLHESSVATDQSAVVKLAALTLHLLAAKSRFPLHTQLLQLEPVLTTMVTRMKHTCAFIHLHTTMWRLADENYRSLLMTHGVNVDMQRVTLPKAILAPLMKIHKKVHMS